MSFLADVFAWFGDPAQWTGSSGILRRSGEHAWLSFISVATAALIALPCGLVVGHTRRARAASTAVVNIGRAVPSFAIVALALPISIRLGLGLGFWPTFIALVALALPPIFVNAAAGVSGVPADVVEAARGTGMKESDVLRRVELPLGAPVIVSGLRVAAVQVVATATLGALVAWGGLGRFIVDGLAQRDTVEVFAGALLVALLAVATELIFAAIERTADARWRRRTTGGYGPRRTSRRRPEVDMRAFVSVVLLALFAGCGSPEPSGQAGESPDRADLPQITVGSANFAESFILAEIYAQALDAEGYRTNTRLNVGSREIYYPALKSGQIDLFPEYTGALVRFVTKDDASATPDSDDTYKALREALDGEGLVALEMAEAEDKDAFAVTAETARELGLETVSDLKDHAADLVFGGPPECADRPSCLKGLREVYGIEFGEVKSLDVGGPLTVAALEGGEIDVGLMLTTAGVVAEKNFVILEDDQGIEVAQNVVPIIRQEIVDAYGDELTEFIDSVTSEITTEELTELNKRVEVDKADPEVVARDWLEERDFVG